MAPMFFNTLFNLSQFVLAESRDPIRIHHVHATPQLTPWDRYAIAGYYHLAEEGEQEQQRQNQAQLEDDDLFDTHLQDAHGGLGISGQP